MRIRSTNVARPKLAGGRAKRLTGIEKRAASVIEVIAPGPNHGDGSGVVGDLIGDTRHHGGADKAIYAVSREELDHWERESGRTFPDGWFGENLTTEGLDLAALVIGGRFTVADAVLEVSIPRQPCQTFAIHMALQGWTRRFVERGDCGAYLRVITPGRIRPGDEVHLGPSPRHGVTMATAFAAVMGNDEAAASVVAANCLPARYHDALALRVSGRTGGGSPTAAPLVGQTDGGQTDVSQSDGCHQDPRMASSRPVDGRRGGDLRRFPRV